MKNLSKSAAMLTAMLLISKGLGFIREICLANNFGTSYVADVYTASIALPSVLFAVYAYGFSDAYIPSYMRIREDQEKERFFSNVTTILFVGSLLIVGICFYLSPLFADILAPGFQEDARTLLNGFIRQISFVFPIMTVFSMLCAHLQAMEKFTAVYFCDFIMINVVIILSILVSSEDTPYILIYGYLLSRGIALVILWIYAGKRNHLRYIPQFTLGDPHFSMLCKLAIPVGISRVVSELNGVADRIFASLLGEGVTSALSYANKVQVLLYTLTTSVFLTVCYPRVSRCFSAGDQDGGMYYIRKAFLAAVYISLPVMGGLFLFATPIVSFLFERGSFTAESTVMTSGCLAFYALGIPFYALREICSRALSAAAQQRRIMKNTMLSVLLNILLNAVLLRPLGYIGLAMATSLAGLLTSILMLLDLDKLGMHVLQRNQFGEVLKILGNSGITLSACFLLYDWGVGIFSNTVALILTGITGCVMYIAMSILFRIEIFQWLCQHLPSKVRVFFRMK